MCCTGGIGNGPARLFYVYLAGLGGVTVRMFYGRCCHYELSAGLFGVAFIIALFFWGGELRQPYPEGDQMLFFYISKDAHRGSDRIKNSGSITAARIANKYSN